MGKNKTIKAAGITMLVQILLVVLIVVLVMCIGAGAAMEGYTIFNGCIIN